MSQREGYTVPPGFSVSGGAGGTSKLIPVLIDPTTPPAIGDAPVFDGTNFVPQAPSGGGSSPILVADFQLTDAQFKALPTGPATVLPPPPTGFGYVLDDWLLLLDTSAGGYSHLGGYVFCFLTSNLRRCGFFDSVTVPTLLDTILPSPGINLLLPSRLPDAQSSGPALLGDAVQLSLDNVDNANDYNSIGAFTGGNALNTLSGRIWYRLVPVTPFGA